MLIIRMDNTSIVCDNCDRTIKYNIPGMTKQAIEKYLKKKTYCGRCVQGRINRNNPNFDFDAEFAYEQPPLDTSDIDINMLD